MLTADLHALIGTATAAEDVPSVLLHSLRGDGPPVLLGYAVRTAGGGSWAIFTNRELFPAGDPARLALAVASSLPGAATRLREAEAGGRRVEGGRFLEVADGGRIPVGGLFSGAVALARSVSGISSRSGPVLSAA